MLTEKQLNFIDECLFEYKDMILYIVEYGKFPKGDIFDRFMREINLTIPVLQKLPPESKLSYIEIIDLIRKSINL